MPENFGDRVKQVRKSAGLTQTEFGDRIGMTFSGVSSIEKGATLSSEQTRRAICKEFKVSRRWLESGEGPMMIEPETPDEMIDEKLADGSEFAKALLRVIARMPDDDLAVVERMFAALRDQLEEQKSGQDD